MIGWIVSADCSKVHPQGGEVAAKTPPERERMRRQGPVHRLEICPRCGAYMAPRSEVQGVAGQEHWQHDSRHRSFGGMKVQVFACEGCGFTQTHQIDVVGMIDEDD